ncbi:hypothetical protein H312_01886, partial [Anncaliia algerae PRA339]
MSTTSNKYYQIMVLLLIIITALSSAIFIGQFFKKKGKEQTSQTTSTTTTLISNSTTPVSFEFIQLGKDSEGKNFLNLKLIFSKEAFDEFSKQEKSSCEESSQPTPIPVNNNDSKNTENNSVDTGVQQENSSCNGEPTQVTPATIPVDKNNSKNTKTKSVDTD